MKRATQFKGASFSVFFKPVKLVTEGSDSLYQYGLLGSTAAQENSPYEAEEARDEVVVLDKPTLESLMRQRSVSHSVKKRRMSCLLPELSSLSYKLRIEGS